MLQFWTTWNFIWYTGFKLNYYKLNSPLKASIISTSIIGGYLVYIYPRRMKVKIGNNIYYLPYPVLIVGDLLFHQLPFFDIMFNNYEYTKICVLYTYIPLFAWYNTAKRIVQGKMEKIYGVSIFKILLTCSTIASGFGLFHHLIKNKK